MQGALKAAAARARFPFLAANVVDAATREPVHWPNVAPTALVEAAGVRVGIVGMVTETGLHQTLAAHVEGLATLPLAPTVAAEARTLRERGANIDYFMNTVAHLHALGVRDRRLAAALAAVRALLSSSGPMTQAHAGSTANAVDRVHSSEREA